MGNCTLCVDTRRGVISYSVFVEIHREIQAVYGSNVMTVQHLRKWCQELVTVT